MSGAKVGLQNALHRDKNCNAARKGGKRPRSGRRPGVKENIIQEMNDTEFLRMVGQIYEHALSKDDDDYILNAPQYLKLVETQTVFTR